MNEVKLQLGIQGMILLGLLATLLVIIIVISLGRATTSDYISLSSTGFAALFSIPYSSFI